MAARLCIEPGCTELGNPRCPDCTAARRPPLRQRRQANRERDARRGGTAQRGYGPAHRRERAQWQARLDSGEQVGCWRCGQPIDPASWHLGHDDVDRSVTRGPECPRCNLAAAGRAAGRRRA